MLAGEDLAAFLAIARHRHFARAADALGTAQSVVSKRLARLEDQLGARLVTRAARAPIALTRAGALFLPEAEAALAALQRSERLGRRLAAGESGPLRLGYVFSAAMTGVLTGLLAACARQFPAIEITARPMETPAQLAELAEGRLDMALTRPRAAYPAGISAHPVHEEGLIVALAASHRLAGEAAIAPADLAGETFLTPQFGAEAGLAEAVERVAREGRFAPPAIRPTGDFITAAALAAAGLGVVLAPASLARLGLAGLAMRPLAGAGERLRLMLCLRPEVAPPLRRLLLEQLSLPG